MLLSAHMYFKQNAEERPLGWQRLAYMLRLRRRLLFFEGKLFCRPLSRGTALVPIPCSLDDARFWALWKENGYMAMKKMLAGLVCAAALVGCNTAEEGGGEAQNYS